MVTRLPFVIASLCIAGLLTGCASLEPRPELPVEAAVPTASGTVLDGLIAEAEARHPGESGFRLVREGPEAFAIRARTAALAGRSLDVQTYIWHDDLTGRYLATRLLEAADRGVKVRLLVDDMDARDKNYGFAALDAHPNIEVRMFNPFESRSGRAEVRDRGAWAASAASTGACTTRPGSPTTASRSSAAATWATSTSARATRSISSTSTSRWSARSCATPPRRSTVTGTRRWPTRWACSHPTRCDPDDLQSLRGKVAAQAREAEQSRFAQELRQNDAVQRLVAGDWPMHWAANYRFVADDPAKALGQGERPGGIAGAGHARGRCSKSSTRSVSIISPYFVPGEKGTEFLVGIDKSGSERPRTDQFARGQRRRDGVRRLLEVAQGHCSRAAWSSGNSSRRQVARSKSSFFGSSGASLHTKALTVDGRLAFVGSYNLDPRSTSLNCEQGVFVESPAIAAQLEEIFRIDSSPDHAWSVTLERGDLRWQRRQAGLRQFARGLDGSPFPGLAGAGAADRFTAVTPRPRVASFADEKHTRLPALRLARRRDADGPGTLRRSLARNVRRRARQLRTPRTGEICAVQSTRGHRGAELRRRTREPAHARPTRRPWRMRQAACWRQRRISRPMACSCRASSPCRATPSFSGPAWGSQPTAC